MIGTHLLTAEVAPAVPALGGVATAVAALFTFLAFLACAGMRQAWGATLGYMLRWVAAKVRDVSIPTGFFGDIHPLGELADALEAVDHLVSHALAVAALNTEHAAVYLWHTTAEIFIWTGQEIARLANDTLHFAESLYQHKLPHLRREIIHQATRITDAAVGRLARTVRGDVRLLHRAIDAAEAKALRAVHAVEHVLDQVIPQVRGLERDFTGLKKRLEKLEGFLNPAALVAFIGATVFTHFGLEWLRCNSNPFKGNKNACGLWGDLAGLLGLVTAVLIAEDFEKLVREMQAVEGEAISVARDLFNVG